MNVADSTTQINPPIPTISNPERLCPHLDQLVGDLKSTVCQAAQKSASFDTVELNVRKFLNEIGKAAIDLFIPLQGDGDLGEEIVTDQGPAAGLHGQVVLWNGDDCFAKVIAADLEQFFVATLTLAKEHKFVEGLGFGFESDSYRKGT